MWCLAADGARRVSELKTFRCVQVFRCCGTTEQENTQHAFPAGPPGGGAGRDKTESTHCFTALCCLCVLGLCLIFNIMFFCCFPCQTISWRGWSRRRSRCWTLCPAAWEEEPTGCSRDPPVLEVQVKLQVTSQPRENVPSAESGVSRRAS